jgi:two-component system sensor histidine kinase TctE
MKQNSLSRLLLQQLLPSIGIVLLVGGVLGYWIAHRSATLAYDRALLDANLAIAGQISIKNRQVDLHLPEAAQRVLLADAFDTIYFEVIGPDGRQVGGNAILPRGDTPSDAAPVFYDGEYSGSPIRLAAMQFRTAGDSFLVIAAETMVKRNKLVHEILVAMLLPGLLLALACVALVYRGTRKGLAGIPHLRDELAHRSQADLSPLPLNEVPGELVPLFEEINDLLLRLADSIEKQRNFVADASHQLRTPIATLLVEAEQALKVTNPKDELKNIVASTQRLGHLAHQLLTFSRIEPGHLSKFSTVELPQLVERAANRWLKPAKLRQIDLGFDLAQASVLGDAFWLEELADNLVDNAIRYTPLHGMITVRCGLTPGSAWMEIEDSGPGIPEEEHGKVFERFHRLHSTDTVGCGLGLAIVKGIATAHHATISIAKGSQHGGALVRISFPENY